VNDCFESIRTSQPAKSTLSNCFRSVSLVVTSVMFSPAQIRQVGSGFRHFDLALWPRRSQLVETHADTDAERDPGGRQTGNALRRSKDQQPGGDDQV